VALLITLSHDACPRSILISHMNYKVVFIVCVCTNVRIEVCVRMYVCVCTSAYVCMYVGMHECMSICMYIYIHMYVCVCLKMHFSKYSYQLVVTLNPTALIHILPIDNFFNVLYLSDHLCSNQQDRVLFVHRYASVIIAKFNLSLISNMCFVFAFFRVYFVFVNLYVTH